MGKGRQFLERIADAAELNGEALPGDVLVEVAGESRVLIENHSGVKGYSRERIDVKVKFGTICICGSYLELARMTTEQLIIRGRIDSVHLHRRN